MASFTHYSFYLVFFISASLLLSFITTSDIVFQYPPGIIPCKVYTMYEETTLDCSKRMLVDIPSLDRNSTTSLKLNNNMLAEIKGRPFEKLARLKYLNMSSNNIFNITSAALSDLHDLEQLFLQDNMLTSLPEDIFVDLIHLQYLDLSGNLFSVVPPKLNWMTLHSLKGLHVDAKLILTNSISLEIAESFQNMRSLINFLVGVSSNITSRSAFQYLTRLPIEIFVINWFTNEDTDVHIEHGITLSLPNVQKLTIPYRTLNAFKFLCPQVKLIYLQFGESDSMVLDNSTLKSLAQWNSTLRDLEFGSLISTEAKRTIADFAFTWTPLIVVLDLEQCDIQLLSNNAFSGLNSLETLILAHNHLNEVPSHTFHAFQSHSLRKLDLSFNGIFKIASHAFSLLTSLKSLNLEGNSISLVGHWFVYLSNLISLNMNGAGEINIGARSSSLQILHIKNAYSLLSLPNICSLFPNLTHVTLSASNTYPVPPISLALHKCLQLEYLDLSDSTQQWDFGTRTATLPYLRNFKFAGNQLTSLKKILVIKANLKSLDLSRNSLTAIEDEDMLAFPDLIGLNLETNTLTSIAGLKSLKFLRHLNVANNQLTVIPNWMFRETDLSVYSLEGLDLSNNPYQCTCNIEKFRKWILSDTIVLLVGARYACASPKYLEGQSITAIDLDCSSKAGFYTIVSIPCILMTLILLALLYKYRWHIKYMLHLICRHYRPFPNLDEEFEMIDGINRYHAYVAYNDESRRDEAWVLDELQPNIENGPEPFKLCIRSRDFIPGQSLFGLISDRIERSRKTILVLTPQFIESQWCHHEMETAQMLLFQQERDVLVLVLLEDIPELKISLSLRKLLCHKKYLKWPNDRAGQGLFWQRLREELKKPVNVDRLCDF